MRDLGVIWPSVPNWATAEHTANALRVRTLSGLSQHLVSGNLAAFAANAGLPNESAGALQAVTGDTYALRTARDRMLVINGSPDQLSPGWHSAGYAVTDISAALHVFEIEGDGIPALLSEALVVDPDNAGPSASVMFAGQVATLYYHESRDRLRLHIERGFASYLWSWLGVRS
jgi:sarcosine oxidase gamma subunit